MLIKNIIIRSALMICVSASFLGSTTTTKAASIYEDAVFDRFFIAQLYTYVIHNNLKNHVNNTTFSGYSAGYVQHHTNDALYYGALTGKYGRPLDIHRALDLATKARHRAKSDLGSNRLKGDLANIYRDVVLPSLDQLIKHYKYAKTVAF